MESNKNGASSIRGFNSTAIESNDHKCVICCLVVREPVEQATCGHRCCKECMMRENCPSSCPVDNEALLVLESRNGGQGCVTNNNTHLAEPPLEQAISELRNDEQGVGPSIPDEEGEQTLNQSMQDGEERQPTYQRVNDNNNGEGDASSFLIAIGGQASEISCSVLQVQEVAVAGHWLSEHERQPGCQRQANDDQGDALSHPMAISRQVREISGPIPEMEEIAGLNTRERHPVYQQNVVGRSYDLNHSILNGGEDVSREVSSIQESLASQLVNGQQQPPGHQQSPQPNALSNPTQQMNLHVSQRRDRQGVCPPIQETVPSADRTPEEHEELPPCRHQLSGADINEVSSTGQMEQTAEHNCSRKELQLWKQKLDRAEPQKATRNKMNQRETFFIETITEVRQRRQGGNCNGEPIAFFSSAIYTDSYEYKLGIRIYLNGVENESGRYVAIFVNMMMGEYDNIEVWPFTQRITLSILDQSDAKRHISQSMLAKPNLSAFQKPTKAISCTGCGFVKFASIEEVFSPHYQYVKDDKLFLKIVFSS